MKKIALALAVVAAIIPAAASAEDAPGYVCKQIGPIKVCYPTR